MISKINVPLRAGLVTALVFFLSCAPYSAVRERYLTDLRALVPPPARPVIIIPGFGQSRLYDPARNQYVWGTLQATVRVHYEDDFDLPVDAHDGSVARDRLIAQGFVGSRGPINPAWHLGDALQRFAGYDSAATDPDTAAMLYRFAYDWRLSYFDSGSDLGDFIERVARSHGKNDLVVDVVTHSSGAMVLAGHLARNRDARARIGRVVMIAAPIRGSIEAFRLLNDEEQIVRRRMGPLTSVTFQSVLELLPDDGRVLIDETGNVLPRDLWDAETWRNSKLSIFAESIAESARKAGHAELHRTLVETFPERLRRARAAHQQLRHAIESLKDLTMIYGDCVPTARFALLRQGGTLAFYEHQLSQKELSLKPKMFTFGDGSVASTSASSAAGEKIALCDGHFAIALDRSTHRAMIRALTR